MLEGEARRSKLEIKDADFLCGFRGCGYLEVALRHGLSR